MTLRYKAVTEQMRKLPLDLQAVFLEDILTTMENRLKVLERESKRDARG